MDNRDDRHKMIKQIRSIHKAIRGFCLDAGIKIEVIDLPLESLDDNTSDDIIFDHLQFLVDFRDGPYKDALKFKSQKSDEWWTNLVVIFDNHNLPEQLILSEKFKTMRKAWRKKYVRPKPTTEQNGDIEVSKRVRIRPSESD